MIGKSWAAAVLVAAVVTVSGCGSSGNDDLGSSAGGDLTPVLTASVAGLWVISQAGGDGTADCEGAVIEPVATNMWSCVVQPGHVGLNSLAVTQNGDEYTLAPVPYVCTEGGVFGQVTGWGTVAGDQIEGKIEVDERDLDDGSVTRLERHFVTGSVVGDALELALSRIELFESGVETAACTYTPPVTFQVTVEPPAE